MRNDVWVLEPVHWSVGRHMTFCAPSRAAARAVVLHPTLWRALGTELLVDEVLPWAVDAEFRWSCVHAGSRLREPLDAQGVQFMEFFHVTSDEVN